MRWAGANKERRLIRTLFASTAQDVGYLLLVFVEKRLFEQARNVRDQSPLQERAKGRIAPSMASSVISDKATLR
jgi:hypothetical protein